jgi:fibro-slime domain-containing protein
MRKCLYVWVLACAAAGCSTPERQAPIIVKQTGGAAGTAGDGGVSGVGGLGGVGGGGTAGTIAVDPPRDGGARDAEIITTLPPGFVQTEIGGYKLGAPLDSVGMDAGSGEENGACGNVLLGVLRDFKGRSEAGGHPDFEGPLYGNDITLNLVSTTLGSDQKPEYASMCEEGRASPAPTCPFGPETTTRTNFDQWYRFTENVNKPFLVHLWFAPQSNGVFTFQSLFFFPLDGAGWGNSGNDKQGRSRNFSFTTELHTRFKYNGGERFEFEGDDDVWVFVNRRLAVDLGGLHPKELGSVDLDASAQTLGITKGQVYELDLFHAERHTPESTFRIDTNLSFVNCGRVVPDIPR